MTKHTNLSGKQCKSARSLLKWNQRELAFRSHLNVKDIQLFETGQKQLYQADKEKLKKVFKKEGIEFREHGEVKLNAQQTIASRHQQEHYAVTEDDLQAMYRQSQENKHLQPNEEESKRSG